MSESTPDGPAARPRRAAPRVAAPVLLAGLVLGAGCGEKAAPPVDPALAAKVEQVARSAMTTHKLKSIIVRTTMDGKDVYTGALGESLTGVPATAKMHFRNGAFSYAYLGYITARLVADGVFSATDTIDKWVPELPKAKQIKVVDLPRCLTGYSDYVYSGQFIEDVYLTPLRKWRTDELIDIGVKGPEQFAPGTNFGYSHTNFAVLGRVLERATGKSVRDLMSQYVFGPMRLTETGGNDDTPAIPEPVQHSFTSERRSLLHVPPEIPFYEDSTYWNPSWTGPEGAVQTTNIYDVATSIEFIGTGALTPPAAHALQVTKQVIGQADPTGKCPACAALTEERSYGMGIELQGAWIGQTKEFAGSAVAAGYLPPKKLVVAVSVTLAPEAFDAEGNPPKTIRAVFYDLAAALAGPDTLPRPR